MIERRMHGEMLLALMASVLAALAPSSGAARQMKQGTAIHIADGDMQGFSSGGTREFLGIPYAAPPVGELRWRPPAAPVPWSGVLQATAFASGCPQSASIQGPASTNENCLYLNVFTPEAPSKKLRPVMVWFPGGGNQNGSAGDPVPFPGIPGHFYDATVLSAEQDVVVVTINYRLNVFGFFAHPALAAEDPAYPFAGNQGLLDQRAALRWVRRNIAAFGGNPKRVTIFGESAGSFDTCFQVASPGSRHLFGRAIGESGGCTTRQPRARDGARLAEAFTQSAGCGGAPDELACLRQLPVTALQAALPQGGGVLASITFGPVVDGGFLPDQPRALFDSGHYARVPYILGSNFDEGTLFTLGTPAVTTEAEYLAALQARFGALASQVAAVYPASAFPTPQDALNRVVGDLILVCPTYDTARRAAAGGADTYLYDFSRPIPIPILQQLGLGAFHGSEIVYVFGSIPPPTPVDGALGEAIRGYWTRFARTGNPNRKGPVHWPRYRDATDERLDLDADVTVLTGFRRRECEFWWGVYDAQFGSPSGAFLN